MIKYLVFLILISCANVRHLTNTNISEYKLFKTNRDNYEFYDSKVQLISPMEAKVCSRLAEDSAKDNSFDQGKKYAELYFKALAYDKYKANAIVITNYQSEGPLIRVEGAIYNCKR